VPDAKNLTPKRVHGCERVMGEFERHAQQHAKSTSAFVDALRACLDLDPLPKNQNRNKGPKRAER